MNRKSCSKSYYYPIDSLLTLCTEYVTKHLKYYVCEGYKENIKLLPANIKSPLLNKFITRPYIWKLVDFNTGLSLLVNSNVKRLDLTYADITDDDLKILESCNQLQELYLTRNGVNAVSETAVCSLIKCLVSLTLLCLSHCSAVNDTVLACIAQSCSLMVGIDISYCQNFSDKGLTALASMKNLQSVSLADTKVTNNGLMALIQGPSGQNLTELRLRDCKFVTKEVLTLVCDNCTKMQVFTFNAAYDGVNSCDEHRGFQNFKQLTWTA